MERKSPSIHASITKVGSVKIGNDKNYWIVLKKNNIKKWYPIGQYKKSYKTMSNSKMNSFLVIVGEKNVYIFDIFSKEEQQEENEDYCETMIIKNYINIFIGKNSKKYSKYDKINLYTGSSILVEIKKNKYIFINLEIISFDTLEPIKEFYSILGKNKYFFPFALTQNYAYLIKESVYLKRDFDNNPLDIFYNKKKYKHPYYNFKKISYET